MAPEETSAAPDPANTLSAADRLADLETRIAALENPAALMQAIDAAADIAKEPGERGVRYAIARGIVQNRNGIPGSAEITLEGARGAALAIGAAGLLPVISREIARVHIWRGDAKSAALELLRSLIEAEAAGSGADKALAVAEFGRLNLEAGRYEVALAFLEKSEGLASLPRVREPARIAVNRREALAALGRWDECLDGIDQTIARIEARFRRDNFVARLLKARSLAALGRSDDAAAAAEEAKVWLSTDPQSYEHAEFALLEGFLKRESDPPGAVALLERALERFVDDDLPRHEFDARILLAEVLAGIGRQDDAETCIIRALNRAEARQLPAMGDRVRATAFGFWRPEMVANLSVEDGAFPGAGDRRGRFLIVETLGSGGYGTVQRAINSDTGSEVAIKRLRQDLAQNLATAKIAVATVRNEILAASALFANRSVARTRYLRIDKDGITLVQDYVAGPTLRHELAKETLKPGQLLAIAASTARAVAALHTAKLVHRDLKPDNIILRNGSQPVIIDLGLARLRGAVDTTARIGTQGYAPPEQWSGGSDDRWFGREDVYALGRIITETVAGGEPTQPQRRSLFGRGGARPPGGLDGELGDLVQRMLAEDVAKREVDLRRVAALLDEAALAAERAEVGS